MGWQLGFWDLFCPRQAPVNRGLKDGAEEERTEVPEQQKK